MEFNLLVHAENDDGAEHAQSLPLIKAKHPRGIVEHFLVLNV